MADDEDGLTTLFGREQPPPVMPRGERRPWWVVGGNWWGTLVLVGVWTAMFAVRLWALVVEGASGPVDIGLLVLSGLMACCSAPSLVYLARRRRARR